jgi:acyl-CoA dehydrogenase
MDFDASPEIQALLVRLREFMRAYVCTAESVHYEQEHRSAGRWAWQPILRELRARAKAEGLCIFPLPKDVGGHGLTLPEYAPLAEIMGTNPIGTETFNCYTGPIWHSRLILPYATPEARKHYLPRLLGGAIPGAITISEPDVPGSDPTELKFEARREENEYVLNCHKSSATGSRMNTRSRWCWRAPIRMRRLKRATRSSSCRAMRKG